MEHLPATGAWRELAASGSDVALLQEAAEPPKEIESTMDLEPGPWKTDGAGTHRPWRATIVCLSNRVSLQRIATRPLSEASVGELGVSRPGTLSAATVKEGDGEPIVLVSAYALWERPLASTGSSWIYADASVHRLISDLSALIGRQEGSRILVAGDWNILHGYGEHGNRYWAARYATVFDRLSALGLEFVGPQAPNGRAAEPWPEELPRGSRNVPTYHTRQQSPESATRQLDFVFASRGLAESVEVKARNDPADWGPSDHCRIEIEVR